MARARNVFAGVLGIGVVGTLAGFGARAFKQFRDITRNPVQEINELGAQAIPSGLRRRGRTQRERDRRIAELRRQQAGFAARRRDIDTESLFGQVSNFFRF